MTKFSIIVPVYNVENYLEECLNSIISQTYRNIEIICIDDGATDNSGNILDKYALADNRISVFHERNGGYGHAVNKGLEKATGEYIGIVESDDYIAPDMFHKFARDIETFNNEVDVVKYSYTRLSKDEKNHRKLFEECMCEKVISPKEYMDLFRVQCSVWSAVYRKQFLTDNHIIFLETPGASFQDMAFSFKVFCRAKNIVLSNDSIYFYRTNNVESSVHSSQKALCVCDEIREIDAYISRLNVASSFVINARYIFMYQSYWWNYYRIYGGMRYVFWLEMVKEMKAMVSDPYLDNKYFTTKEWDRIQRILSDPEKYYNKENPYFKTFFNEEPLNEYTIKEHIYKEGLIQYFNANHRFMIYGAGVYGKKVLEFMKKNNCEEKLTGFIVTDRTNLPGAIEGIPLYEICELPDSALDITIIVAVKSENQLEILRILKKSGIKKVIRVDTVFISMMKEINRM